MGDDEIYRLALAWKGGLATDEDVRRELVRDGYTVGRSVAIALSERIAVLWRGGKVDILWNNVDN